MAQVQLDELEYEEHFKLCKWTIFCAELHTEVHNISYIKHKST